MSLASRNSHDAPAEPITHWPSVAAATAIGLGGAACVGLLWTAVAFSSHDNWAYSHLAWWLGGTVIGAAAIAGIIAGGLSRSRGLAAGTINGLTAGTIVAAVAGGIALLGLVINGSFNEPLVWGNHRYLVEFLRPYVAFWTVAGSLALGAVGGAAGGLLPRRSASRPVVELASVTSVRPEVRSDGNTTAAPRPAAGF
jgi:hypothetical protein